MGMDFGSWCRTYLYRVVYIIKLVGKIRNLFLQKKYVGGSRNENNCNQAS
jgi:hypothetical protein